uniref:DUF4283 domain-containing protein n=1 Tax=Cajanus cajan TaxID=3821 RepID=A0A151SFS2_CAJCA|nr:hypothetical protein KK1_024254 [Cajanus cajan]
MLKYGCFDLPLEYWVPRILFSIAASVGDPILIDNANLNQSYEHFARVLAEFNLAGDFMDQILVEREGYAFYVSLVFEKLPDFCFSCFNIGHRLLPTIRHYLPGPAYTWTNNRSGPARTDKKLDRFMCNDLFLSLWTRISGLVLHRVRSNHHPIMLSNLNESHASPFKFLSIWIQHLDCRNIVSKAWNTVVLGNPMQILS